MLVTRDSKLLSQLINNWDVMNCGHVGPLPWANDTIQPMANIQKNAKGGGTTI